LVNFNLLASKPHLIAELIVKNKTCYMLVSCLVLILVLLIVNYRKISDLMGGVYLSLMNAQTKSQGGTTPIGKANLNQNQIKALLQQRYMGAVEQELAESGNSEDLDNKAMIEEALRDLYTAQEGQDRELAVMTLGEYVTPQTKEGLLFALDDPDIIVREQAVIQISEWEDEKERQQMQLIALSNDSIDIVIQTLESITEINDNRLIERLNKLIKNKNKNISEAADLALDLVDDPD
jgi:hypothetical protein